MAYAELEPISNLAEVFARRYASMLRFHEFMQQPAGIDAASLVILYHRCTLSLHWKIRVFPRHFFWYDPRRPVLQNVNL